MYRACGINLHEGKESLLTARLSKRMHRIGIHSAEEYLRLLESDGRERIDFLDAISTNHTFFFRESHHFACLQDTHSNIWCAASASGEEPYSIAIHCLEKGFAPAILATDISTRVLKVGERGIYSMERAVDIPPALLRKYFQKGYGKWREHIRVKETVRRMVAFARFNLLSDPPPPREFDVIFCRNVLIYFDSIVKQQVIEKLYGALKQEGYLVIGGAETLNNISHRYRYQEPSIYRKA